AHPMRGAVRGGGVPPADRGVRDSRARCVGGPRPGRLPANHRRYRRGRRGGGCGVERDPRMSRSADVNRKTKETEVRVRLHLAYHAEPPTWQKLGDYDVALTPEFFRALATHGGLTLHVDLLRGQNAHHVVEAVFKAAARALGDATSLDPRVQDVPSTKGAL